MNNRRLASLLVGIILGAGAGVAMAETKGDVELGMVNTSGNSQTRTLNAKAQANTTYGAWTHGVVLQGLNSANQSSTTAEKYLAQLKSAYAISDRDYAFGQVLGEWIRFSGYDYRASEVIGYGRKIIVQDNLTLNGEIGVGGRQSKPKDGSTQSEGIGSLGANLLWKISPTSQFGEDVLVQYGNTATISKSVTSLKLQVANNLAAKFSYTLRHVSDVPVGVRKNDTESTVTLVYSF